MPEFITITANALRFDPDQPWEAQGVHGEVHEVSGRRFACVRVGRACDEVEPGDWLLSDGAGNLYPVPAAFVRQSATLPAEETDA